MNLAAQRPFATDASVAPASQLQTGTTRHGHMLLLITLGHLCITVPLAWLLSLWVDEAYTLRTTANGAAQALEQAIQFEMQPPAFYVALSVWRRVAPGLFFARLVSVVCVAVAIPTAAMASRRLCPRLDPGWVGAAMALNPWAIYAAVEARPYAMSLLLTTALLWFFEAGFLRDPSSTRHRLGFACLGLVALYTQYYLGFLLAAAGVALLASRRWRALRSYLSWMMLVGVGFLPLLLAVPDQVASHTASASPAPLTAALRHTISCLEDIVVANARAPGGRAGRWFYRAAFVATLVAAGRARLGGRRRLGATLVPLLTIALALLVSFVTLVVAFGPWVTQTRHMLFFLPVGLLLLYGTAAAVQSPWLPRIVTVLLLSSFGWRLYVAYAPMAKDGDLARVAKYIGSSEIEGQPILVFPGEQVLPLEYHYRGLNQLIPLPGAEFFHRYDPRDFAWVSREHVADRLRETVGTSRECWMITYGTADQVMGYPLRRDLLEAVVGDSFEVVQRRTFWDGTLVRLLRRPKEPSVGRR